jgi:hypothetical protein
MRASRTNKIYYTKIKYRRKRQYMELNTAPQRAQAAHIVRTSTGKKKRQQKHPF